MSENGTLVDVRLLRLPLQERALFTRHLEGLLRELALVQIGAQRDPSSLPARLLGLAHELDTTYAPFRTGPGEVMDAAEAAGHEHCDVVFPVPADTAPFLRRLRDALEEADALCRVDRHLLTLPAPQEVVAYRRWVLGEFLRQLTGGEPRPWTGDDVGRHADGQDDGEEPPAEPLAAPWPAPHEGGGEEAGEDDDDGRVVGRPLLLDPMANTVAAARRYVREALRALGSDALEESAELGVSELVTNAMLHARTAFKVTVRLMPSGAVRIDVTDSSPSAVQPRRFGVSATTGRGLRLVESVSADWGVSAAPEGPGKTVWFEPRETMVDAGFAGDWAAEIDGLT
ncbi:hypothetical protein NUM3379_15010 [Kineococcus sp. NUM-3379]